MNVSSVWLFTVIPKKLKAKSNFLPTLLSITDLMALNGKINNKKIKIFSTVPKKIAQK